MTYYTTITDNIKIGELNAGKEPNDFDIIVNLAYINPTFNRGLNHREHRKTITPSNKILYEFGLYDSDNDVEYFEELLQFIPLFLTDKKILFHCQSGKSRSVSLALAYLCLQTNMSIDDGINLIKQKRPIANPRPLFIDKVREFLTNRKTIY